MHTAQPEPLRLAKAAAHSASESESESATESQPQLPTAIVCAGANCRAGGLTGRVPGH